MWLNDYTDMYTRYTASSGKLSSGELAVRFSRALSTFFDSNSNLALNLPSDVSSGISAVAKETSHPDPAVFAEVKRQVKEMLRDSLMRFVRLSFGNAGKNRTMFSFSFGLFLVVVGFVPAIATFATGTSRWIRIAGWLLMCLGASGAVAAAHGRESFSATPYSDRVSDYPVPVCLLVYGFVREDARQLHPYELAAPRIPDSAVPVTLEKNKHDDYDYDEEHKTGGGGYETDANSTLMTASFIRAPSEYTASIHAPSTTAAGSTGPSSAEPFKFDFDALPSPKKAGKDGDSLFSSSSPVFSSVTKVISPLVQRSHWEIAIKSFFIGHIIGTILTIILVAVPQTHK